MHVVRHQRPSPNRDAGVLAVFLQQVEISRVIVVAEERPLAAVAALSDMMRNPTDDAARQTGQTGHGRTLTAGMATVN